MASIGGKYSFPELPQQQRVYQQKHVTLHFVTQALTGPDVSGDLDNGSSTYSPWYMCLSLRYCTLSLADRRTYDNVYLLSASHSFSSRSQASLKFIPSDHLLNIASFVVDRQVGNK